MYGSTAASSELLGSRRLEHPGHIQLMSAKLALSATAAARLAVLVLQWVASSSCLIY